MKFQFTESAQAAFAQDPPILVTGGPGSGKTALALVKAQLLIEKLESEQQILFLSFSRAAVRQVLLKCGEVLTSTQRRVISVMTYHAFCMDILTAHGRLLTGSEAQFYFPSRERVDRAAFEGDWETEKWRLASDEGLYSFSVFANASSSLLGIAAVRKLISDKYPFIILDEFQDTDDSQWELVKLLAQDSGLVVLADPEQRIFDYDPRVNPKRIDQLREYLVPTEFDLGGDNHRSPDAGILQFADSVLHNRALPVTSSVQMISYWPRNFEAHVHASVVWMMSALAKLGIDQPSIAVLGRTNAFVETLSAIFSVEHCFNGSVLPPVDHDVLWDADLIAAAAQVVASILEWPVPNTEVAVAKSSLRIASYFEVKNALRSSRQSLEAMTRYHRVSEDLLSGGSPQIQIAQTLFEIGKSGFEVIGNPSEDWEAVIRLLSAVSELEEISTKARLIRPFKGNDVIGSRLAREWLESGSYGKASEIVKRLLDRRTVLSDAEQTGRCVLMTIHKAKGKEFDGVVLVEGLWSKFFDERDGEPFLSARRLLRVGITRARYRVTMVRPSGVRSLVV
jgi:DNA helicase-2/ATP-dependent DNA helicase PcrA